MEDQVFPSEAVAELLESGYVEARLHNDHPDSEVSAENRRLQEEYVGYVAAPYYVIVDPATRVKLGEHRLQGVGSGWDKIATDFRGFLERFLPAQRGN
jgi:hypothetical protein